MEKLKNKRKYINDLKNKSGITLIALVITIIVLLLLAGVAIATLTGKNGLITRAKQAKKAQIEAEIKESLILAVQDLQVEKVGDVTLDDITQEWIDEKLSEYNPSVKDDASISGKKITMKKDGIIKKFLIDEELNITEIENDGEIQFSYEAISRDGENAQILIKVRDTENGLNKIQCPNGNTIECYGTKQEKAIDYTVQIGTEYKFKIISSSGTEQDETVLIDTYWHKITKNIAEGAKIDNPAIKAEYNKEYLANITTKDVLAEDGTVRTDALYVIDSIVVKMGEQEVTTVGNNIVDKVTGKIYIEKVTGNIEINVSVKKIEIQTTEAYIGTSETETDSSRSVADNSQTRGTNKVFINFKAKLEGVDCILTLKDDTSKTLPYEVPANGEYTFVATGTYNGKTIVKDNIKVIVNKYTVAQNLVKYDAGKWTQEEIDDLKSQKLYDYNEKRLMNTTFKLNDENGLNFTFGGFKAGDDRNKSIKPGDDIIDGNPAYDGWQILEIKDSNGNLINKETDINKKLKKLDNEKIYVTKIVHAGSPENFVFRDILSNEAYSAEYLLSGGERGYSMLSDENNTKINIRYWDMYKDKEYENKQMINNVHLMNYNEAVSIERTCTGGRYWLSNSANSWILYHSNYGSNSIEVYAAGHYTGVAGIRPVVEMQDGVYIKSGDGTELSPYVLEK